MKLINLLIMNKISIMKRKILESKVKKKLLILRRGRRKKENSKIFTKIKKKKFLYRKLLWYKEKDDDTEIIIYIMIEMILPIYSIAIPRKRKNERTLMMSTD